MLSEQQQRIMGYFIEEAKDHLNTIEQGLINLQATIEDSEMVHEVFRAAHSVKGGAAMLGLTSIQHTAHGLEDYFKILKECPGVKTTRKLETLFLRVFDTLQALIEQLQGPFGLTEDKAAELMAAVEPVFAELNQDLTALVSQSGAILPEDVEFVASSVPAAPMASKPQPVMPQEESAVQLIFRSDVPALLRQMLQTFKQSDNVNSRQQLQDLCGQLAQPGEQLDIPYWCELLEAVKRSIAYPENSYRVLAPVVIKELKQAQDLVLSGRSIEIAPSDRLLDLLPQLDWGAGQDSGAGGESDLSSWFNANEDAPLLTNSVLLGLEPEEEFALSLEHGAIAVPEIGRSSQGSDAENTNAEDEDFLGDLFVQDAAANGAADESDFFLLDLDEPEAVVDRSGPGVGDAELNSLADLFEANLDAESSSELSWLDSLDDSFDSSMSEMDTALELGDEVNEASLPQEPFDLVADDLSLAQSNGEASEPLLPLDETESLFPSFQGEETVASDEMGLPDLEANLLGDVAAEDWSTLPESLFTEASSPEEPFSFDLGFEVDQATDSGETDFLASVFGELDRSDSSANLFDQDSSNDSPFAASRAGADAEFLDLFPLEATNDELTEDVNQNNQDSIAEEIPGNPENLLGIGKLPETVEPSAEFPAADLDGLMPEVVEAASIDRSEFANLDGTDLAPFDNASFDNAFFDNVELDGSGQLSHIEPQSERQSDTESVELSAEAVPELLSPPDLSPPEELLFNAEIAGDLWSDEAMGLEQDEAGLGFDIAELLAADAWVEQSDQPKLEIAETEADSPFDLFAADLEAVDTEAVNTEAAISEGFGNEIPGGETSDRQTSSNELALGENFGALESLLSEETSLAADWNSTEMPFDDAMMPDLFEGDRLDAFQESDSGFSNSGFSNSSFSDSEFSGNPSNVSDLSDSDFSDSGFSVSGFGVSGFGDNRSEMTEFADDDFADLEAMLNASAPDAIEAPAAQETADADFADLEALLDDAPPTSPPQMDDVPISGFPPTTSLPVDDEFGDLEELIKDVDQVLGVGSSPNRKISSVAQRRPNRRNVLNEQMMRVSVKHLDNLNNLVGEMVVNRNSLEQAQERLRQFLDNLLYQVQQLSDVGQRMHDLYERSLLERSLLASRRGGYSGTGMGSASSQTSHAIGVSFDALEIDQFTAFHTLSQEMIELIVRVREGASDIDFVVEESDQVTRNFRQITTQLQEGLTRSRMVPFAQTADRLPRGVRDNSLKYGKQIDLVIEGRDTLIDKMIVDQLNDPMTHLVNNAIAHGIETPEERLAAGKPPVGRITIRAFHQGNQTIISVSDDGAGINPERVKEKALAKGLINPVQARDLSRLEVYDLLFQHGFSTVDQADDLRGRGVGLDVVRNNLSEIRGSITIDSAIGRGTTFTIRLPLTLSISKALCCISNRARIAFPMDGVEDMFDLPSNRLQMDEEGRTTIPWRDMILPLQPLAELLRYNRVLGRGSVYGGNQEDDVVSIVVLRSGGNFLALQVDQVLGEQEIVIKQLEGPVPKPIGVAGATVLGDGRIMPIADVLELIDLWQGRIRREPGVNLWEREQEPIVEDTKAEPTVLIVDDSITVRELLSMTFSKVGYRVEQARDGQEAWEKLRAGLPCNLIFCDIEMPRMDGLELLSRLQKDPHLCELPIAMLTSRGADRHKQMAIQLGAKGYFTKPYLEEMLLDAAQRMLRGEVLVNANPTSTIN